MSSFEDAHTKLIKEMNGHEKEPTYEKVLDYLMHRAESAMAAVKIINSEKTISGAIEHMTSIARKKKTGSTYVMTDEEGFKIIDEYYGFGAQALAKSNKNQLSKRIDIDFDDL